MAKKKEATEAKLPSKIADYRKEAGLTQQELAVFVGVTLSTIQKWESGDSGISTILKMLKLITVLDCQLEDLIDEEFIPKKKGFSLSQLKELRKSWIN